MVYGLNPPLVPRRTGKLHVLCVARISTEKQDELSLEDQAGLHKHFVQENYSGKADFEIVATCASGEHLDRQETQLIKDHIATRKFDLVLMEDLGRLLRDVDAVKLCGFSRDYETRLIAINDHVDTAQDNWQDMAMFAAWRHCKYNEDTSRRIKQRLAERFILGTARSCNVRSSGTSNRRYARMRTI